MKTKYLLPSSWRIFGLILTLISVPLTLWILILGDTYPILGDAIKTSWRFEVPDWSYFNDMFIKNEDGTISFLIIDELLGLGDIAGLFILGFSKLKVEDERIAQLRLESLQWGIYANYLILFLCIIFVYGGWFFTVMTYNIFTPLLIFVARFYWLLHVSSIIEAKRDTEVI